VAFEEDAWDERVHNQEIGEAPDNQADDAQYLLDNLDQDADYYSLPFDLEEVIAMSVDHPTNTSSKQLLLDSCSTLNLITDPELLHDIHEVPMGIRVQCNTGSITTNLKAHLGDFLVPVWYNPNSIVNILSFHIMAKYYHVRYDNMQKDEFFVTGPNGIEVAFALTTKGLYACNALHTDPVVEAWACINLTDNQREEYTKQEYCDTVLA